MIFAPGFLEDVRQALDVDSLEWARDAACKDVDQALFYLSRGDSPDPGKRVCATCPVRAECAADALRRNDRWGIWGGLTEGQRRDLKRALNLKISPGIRRAVACKWGHPWTEANTHVDPRGKRRCRECNRERRLAS